MYCTEPFLYQSWERGLLGFHSFIISLFDYILLDSSRDSESHCGFNFEGQQNSRLVAQHKRNNKFQLKQYPRGSIDFKCDLPKTLETCA
jgi:hypothetical protein